MHAKNKQPPLQFTPYSGKVLLFCDSFEYMAIMLQVGSFDHVRYPAVLEGMSERLHCPAVTFVFVDGEEQLCELKQRIEAHIPTEDRPEGFQILVAPITAKQAFTALITQTPPTTSNLKL